MPQFSVIIPIYNRIDFIEKTVDSVLQQRFQDFEIILVDDGSTDGSFDLCQKMATENEKIRAYQLPQNQGRCAARNKGLELAKSQWICYLDSDDQYYSNHLETFAGLIEQFPDQMAFATDQNINDQPKPYRLKKLGKDRVHIQLEDLIEHNPFTANQICHAADLNLRWSEERIPISEDWLFFRELSLKTSILKTAVITNMITDHPQRTMNTAQSQDFVKYNLFTSQKFISENSRSLSSSQKSKISTYTDLLCANVLLSSGFKAQGFQLLKPNILKPRAYGFLLFYKAWLKLIIQ